jgi:hypothetical protein
MVRKSTAYGVRELRSWCWRVMLVVSENNGVEFRFQVHNHSVPRVFVKLTLWCYLCYSLMVSYYILLDAVIFVLCIISWSDVSCICSAFCSDMLRTLCEPKEEAGLAHS